VPRVHRYGSARQPRSGQAYAEALGACVIRQIRVGNELRFSIDQATLASACTASVMKG
jgi:hypothetical protein